MKPHSTPQNRWRMNSARSSERGVVLILTLFVLLITFALVTELTVSTSVAFQTTENRANHIRMEMAAYAAADQFMEALIGDASGAGGASGLEGMLGELAGSGGLDNLADESGFDGAVGGADSLEDSFGEEGEGGEETSGNSSADYLQDVWAKPMRIMVGDFEIMAWAEDENSKFPLFQLVAGTEEEQEESRQRFARILDHMRADFDDDLDQHAGNLIVEDIVRFFKGDFIEMEMPRAPRFSDDTEAEMPIYLPYALEELMLLEHVTEDLYYDQIRTDDLIAPGLESICTIYTTPGFEAPTEGSGTELAEESQFAKDEPSLDPSANDALDQVEGLLGETDESEAQVTTPVGGLDDVLEGDAPFGFAVNVNTAPQSVLEGMIAPFEVSQSVIRQIIEHRNEVDEAALEALEQEDSSRDLAELEQSLYGEQSEDPLQFFETLDDLKNVDGYESGASEEGRQKFESLLSVKSDVFTVYITVRILPEDWVQETRYEEPLGPVLRLRTIVWRRGGGGETRLIPILPWQEVPASRWKIPDFQYDLPLYEPPIW